MASEPVFKTIHECDLDLVGATYSPDFVSGGWLEPQLDDFMPARAARASFGKQDKTGKDYAADVKLMRYLAEHKHMTPFEYQHATFLIEVPLFIRSQIHRHRTFSFNEISRRYTSDDLGFWIPDTFRGQSKSNRQASDGELDDQRKVKAAYTSSITEILAWYEDLLAAGVAREQARAVLPQSLLTRFYMGGNLRNWAHFIELRRDEHAQYEVQVPAMRIAEVLRDLWPESCEALGI